MTDPVLRILFITHYFAPDSGAAAVRLHRLAKLLVARGHAVTVLTTMPHYPQGRIAEAYRGRFTSSEEIDGIRVVRAWIWATPSQRLSRRLISQLTFMITVFLRGLFIKRPDVVLIEAQPMFTGFAASLVSALKRVPVVLNVSDLWPDHLVSVGALTEKHIAYRFLRWMVNGVYRRAKLIVGVSQPLTDGVQQYVADKGKVRTVYNGVDLKRFNPSVDGTAFRQKYGLNDKHVVSFISTFTTPYDFPTMLAVVERLKDRDDIVFVFAGRGAQESVLEERIAKGDLPNLRYLGWLEYDEIPQAWAATTVAYLAIRDHELYLRTLPAKLYEIFACGVPVVMAIRGYTVDLIQVSGGGLTVDPGSVAALSDGIAHYLADLDARRAAGAAGRVYAEQNFDAERVVDQYEAILREAHGNRRSAEQHAGL